MDEEDLKWLLRHLPTKSDMLFIADRIPDNLRKEISDLAFKVMATETWVSHIESTVKQTDKWVSNN